MRAQLDRLLSIVHGTSESEHITLLHVPLTIGGMGMAILQATSDVKSYAAGTLLDKAILERRITL
jgi:hypothetical protein